MRYGNPDCPLLPLLFYRVVSILFVLRLVAPRQRELSQRRR